MKILYSFYYKSSQWHHNGHDGVLNHQPYYCFLNRLFRHRSKKTSKLCVTGLCVGNWPVTSEFPAQMASYAENVSISWHHHVKLTWSCCQFQKLKNLHLILLPWFGIITAVHCLTPWWTTVMQWNVIEPSMKQDRTMEERGGGWMEGGKK